MQCLLRRTLLLTSRPRFLSTSPVIFQKPMPSRPAPPPDSELEESFLKGSGPGGQKINKTNSAVQLKHIPTGIVVKSQATRSRSQNRKHAREILAQKLDDLRRGSESRANIVGAVKKKRADSAAKKSRRKYKRLEEEKAAVAEQGRQGEEAGHKEDTPRDTVGDEVKQSTQKTAEKAAEYDDSTQTSCDVAPRQPTDTTTR
ncbi:hypothetical protein MY11210_004112 [Beauveria gryllotalpidicola]